MSMRSGLPPDKAKGSGTGAITKHSFLKATTAAAPVSTSNHKQRKKTAKNLLNSESAKINPSQHKPAYIASAISTQDSAPQLSVSQLMSTAESVVIKTKKRHVNSSENLHSDDDKPKKQLIRSNSLSNSVNNISGNISKSRQNIDLNSSMESSAINPSGDISSACSVLGIVPASDVDSEVDISNGDISDGDLVTSENIISDQQVNSLCSANLKKPNSNNKNSESDLVNNVNVDPEKNSQKTLKTANLDLSSLASSETLPVTTRQVLIAPISNDTAHNLIKINPFKVGGEIESICGPVSKIEYKKSGSLLITTESLLQVYSLLKVTKLFSNIPVSVSVAWGTELSQGKLYAPEFSSDTIKELLDMLKPYGVVGVRKLYQDPAKKNTPLFILTFLSSVCPRKLRTKYTTLNIDPYYPSPLMCGKCCLYGHSSMNCRSQTVCSRCGVRGHLKADCTAETIELKCPNCKGPHEARSKMCPAFQKERDICVLKVNEGISFQAARNIVNSTPNYQAGSVTLNKQNNVNTKKLLPNIQSKTDFPNLIHSKSPTTNNDYWFASQLPSTNAFFNHPAASASPPQLESQASPTYAQPLVSQQQPTVPSQHYQQPDRVLCHAHSTKPSVQQPTEHSSDFTSSNSIENSWITPGQRDQQPLNNSTTNSSYTALPRNYPKHDQPPKESSIFTDADIYQKIMLPAMPVFVKLLFANSISDKIECLLELGTIFKMESVVGGLLDKMGLSSLSYSQQV